MLIYWNSTWSTMSAHYNDTIMSAMASQITDVSIVCLTVCSGADQRKHQSSASLAFVRRIHRWWVDSPHKGPVMRKMFSFADVVMFLRSFVGSQWFRTIFCLPDYCRLSYKLLTIWTNDDQIRWQIWVKTKNIANLYAYIHQRISIPFVTCVKYIN